MKKETQSSEKSVLLHDQIIEMEKDRNELSNNIILKKCELQKICRHEKTEVQNDYIEGGYTNREQFIKRTICVVCGKMLDEKITSGGFC